MAGSEDKSTTFSNAEAISIVTATADVPHSPCTSLVGTDEDSLPVASTLEDSPVPAPVQAPVESCWGLTPRDCLLLLVLAIACLGLSVWHWGQLSGWGLQPVEVERLPERVYDYRIDINQATWVEWMQLPGVGETLAKRIMEYREENGPFQSVDEMDDIKGIGPKTLEKLRPWLMVQEQTAE
jgi:competence protein ComEA